jgi:TolB-like protein
MKKSILSLVPFSFFILGCAGNNINVDKQIQETKFEKQLVEKYHITKNAMTKIGDNYYFYQPDANGIAVFELDNKYNLKKKKVIKKLIEGHKLLSDGKNIYLIGYDQIKNRPIIVIFDNNLNVKNEKYFSDKFDIPKDAIIENGSLTVLLLTYKDGADIKIYSNNKTKTFSQKDNQLPNFIKKYKDGYIIVGSYQYPRSEDLLVVFVKNGKIIWSKTYDFGLDDTPKKVIIKNNNIIIDLVSQDYMGAEKYITITLDKNGDIKKAKKNLEYKVLPTRFRT